MYGWIWRHLPGPLAARIAAGAVPGRRRGRAADVRGVPVGRAQTALQQRHHAHPVTRLVTCACSWSTTTTASSTTSSSTWPSSAPSAWCGATTPVRRSDEIGRGSTGCWSAPARVPRSGPARASTSIRHCAEAGSAGARRVPRPSGDRRGLGRAPSTARRNCCTARRASCTTTARGVLAGAARPVHRDPVPLADRAAGDHPGRVRGHRRAPTPAIVMAMRHRELPVEGVQFHPESVLTDGGHRMLANWLRCAASRCPRPRSPTWRTGMRALAEAAADASEQGGPTVSRHSWARCPVCRIPRSPIVTVDRVALADRAALRDILVTHLPVLRRVGHRTFSRTFRSPFQPSARAGCLRVPRSRSARSDPASRPGCPARR